MNSTIRKWITGIVVAPMILVGTIVAAPVAMASPAEAAGTHSNCRVVDSKRTNGFAMFYPHGTVFGRYARYCYVDHNWFNETFRGYKDGRTFVAVSNNYNAMR